MSTPPWNYRYRNRWPVTLIGMAAITCVAGYHADARNGVIRIIVALAAHLPAMAQEMIGEHAGHHGFADRHRADADAGVVAAFGGDVGVGALAIHGAARGQDRGCRLDRKARHHRLPGGDAAQNAAGLIGQEADALIAHPHLVSVFLAG